MTVPLSATSARRVAAARFGAELKKAMIARSASKIRLAPAAHVTASALGMWRSGNNIPRLDTAARLADALQWPRLLEIAREARCGACETCGRPFVNEGGTNKRYCSDECREIAAQLRQPTPGKALVVAVKEALARGGSVRRDGLAAAIAVYDQGEARRVQRVDRAGRKLTVVMGAVDAMCRSCEPEGVCRTPECALRPVSPLPLALAPGKVAAEVRVAGTSWDAENAPKTLAAVRAGNAKRWARPGAREAQSEAGRAFHAAMSPAEREAHGRKISAARRQTDEQVPA